MKKSPALEVRGLSKTFPEKKMPACNEISFNLYKGEITALTGENGAGKSTLVNMITGEILPDSGTIYLNGENLSAKKKYRKEQSKMGQIHQNPVLAPELTFFTNIIAGKYPPPKIINKKKESEKLALLAKKYNLDVPLKLKSEEGTLLQQQNCELLSILQNNPEVIIIDEPAALLEKEWEQSFLSLLEFLRETGMAILLISHKISELIPYCQHVITLKNGKRVESTQYKNSKSDYSWANQLPPKLTKQEILKKEQTSHSPDDLNSAMLKCIDISVTNKTLIYIKNISFSLFPHEILAIEGSREAGLNLVESLFTGMIRFNSGKLIFKGENVSKTRWNASFFRKNGGAAIPAQRITEGCVPSASVSDNQIFSKEQRSNSPFLKSILSRKVRSDKVKEKRKIFPFEGEAFQPLNQLSGGNIQRIILARELDPIPDILVISEPSRGLDDAGRKELFSQLIRLRNRGCAILLLSADFIETTILADRIFRINKDQLEEIN